MNRNIVRYMKNRFIAVIWILTPFSAQSTWASSPGMESLYYFFNEIKTFKARFVQIVFDESLNVIDDSQGKVWIERPGLFRWNYEPPDAQEIVGDGVNVWIYDIELEQVTVRKQQFLGNAPAILLAGVDNLEDHYHIKDIGSQGRFDWISLIPKDKDSSFNKIRIGFEENQLKLMELPDNLGQKIWINFVDLKENLPIPATAFDFIIPDGVDIIDNTEE